MAGRARALSAAAVCRCIFPSPCVCVCVWVRSSSISTGSLGRGQRRHPVDDERRRRMRSISSPPLNNCNRIRVDLIQSERPICGGTIHCTVACSPHAVTASIRLLLRLRRRRFHIGDRITRNGGMERHSTASLYGSYYRRTVSNIIYSCHCMEGVLCAGCMGHRSSL